MLVILMRAKLILLPTNPTDALALALLARMVYFAPDEPIPHDLLLSTIALADDPEDALLQAEDAVLRLVELGLVESTAPEEDTLHLHRLVVAFLREMIDDPEAQKAVEQAMAHSYERMRATLKPGSQR